MGWKVFVPSSTQILILFAKFCTFKISIYRFSSFFPKKIFWYDTFLEHQKLTKTKFPGPETFLPRDSIKVLNDVCRFIRLPFYSVCVCVFGFSFIISFSSSLDMYLYVWIGRFDSVCWFACSSSFRLYALVCRTFVELRVYFDCQ